MMPIRVEAYTNEGIATGVVARPGHLRDVLEAATELVIEQSSWIPIDGSGETAAPELKLLVDDILLVVADEPDGIPVHHQWHSIELDAGPFRVHGEMPTMPGFDPAQSLARPTGEFVLLRDARIVLIDNDDAGEVSSAQILVNRYTVDRIAADLMLGFFFPGAAMTVTGTSAGEHVDEAAEVPATAPAQALSPSKVAVLPEEPADAAPSAS